MGEQKDLFDEHAPNERSEFRRRVIDAIGEDGLKKIAEAGLQVCDQKDLDNFEREAKNSLERNRELARASMRAADLRSMLVEMHALDGGLGLRVIVCDPAGDEDETLRKAMAVLKIACDKPRKTPQKSKRADGG